MGGLPAFAAVTRAVFPGGGTELFYSGHPSQIAPTHLSHWVAGLKVAQLLPRPCYCSVAKSCPTLQSHGRQSARLPCPPLPPGLCSNSCPWSRCYRLTISSSATLLSFSLQSFPASGSFPMSQFFPSGGQSIGASVST